MRPDCRTAICETIASYCCYGNGLGLFFSFCPMTTDITEKYYSDLFRALNVKNKLSKYIYSTLWYSSWYLFLTNDYVCLFVFHYFYRYEHQGPLTSNNIVQLLSLQISFKEKCQQVCFCHSYQPMIVKYRYSNVCLFTLK